MGEFDRALYLLHQVLSNAYEGGEMHKKAIYNISNIYSLIKSYDLSITTLNDYLENNKTNWNINYDNIIYFKKATVSYRVGDRKYYNYALRCLYSSILSNDIKNGLTFLRIFNNLFDEKKMSKEEVFDL